MCKSCCFRCFGVLGVLDGLGVWGVLVLVLMKVFVFEFLKTPSGLRLLWLVFGGD